VSFEMAYRLIVADDSPSIQRVIKMAFPETEFEIFSFADGREVMKSISEIKPDAILLNLSLPHKDGYEVGSYLKSKEQFSQTPLILLKGAFEPLDKERIASIDYDELIHEPFDSEGLVQMVRSIIEGRKIPLTLPEEPILDEISDPEVKVEFDEKVKDLVREEILGVERELEKRIKARILAEIKEHLKNK